MGPHFPIFGRSASRTTGRSRRHTPSMNLPYRRTAARPHSTRLRGDDVGAITLQPTHCAQPSRSRGAAARREETKPRNLDSRSPRDAVPGCERGPSPSGGRAGSGGPCRTPVDAPLPADAVPVAPRSVPPLVELTSLCAGVTRLFEIVGMSYLTSTGFHRRKEADGAYYPDQNQIVLAPATNKGLVRHEGARAPLRMLEHPAYFQRRCGGAVNCDGACSGVDSPSPTGATSLHRWLSLDLRSIPPMDGFMTRTGGTSRWRVSLTGARFLFASNSPSAVARRSPSIPQRTRCWTVCFRAPPSRSTWRQAKRAARGDHQWCYPMRRCSAREPASAATPRQCVQADATLADARFAAVRACSRRRASGGPPWSISIFGSRPHDL